MSKINFLEVKKHIKRRDSIYLTIVPLIIIFTCIISIFRITLVGQFLDDVLFEYVFGWFKYLIYLTLIIVSFVLFVGYKVSVSKRFKFWSFGIYILLSMFFSNITLIFFHLKHPNLLKIWDPNIFVNVIKFYSKNWLDKSIFHHKIIITSFFNWHGQWFFSTAGGGLFGGLLTSLFCYFTIYGSLVITIILTAIFLIWALTGHPLGFIKRFRENSNSFKIISITSKKSKKTKYKLGLFNNINHEDEILEADDIIKYDTIADVAIKSPNAMDSLDNRYDNSTVKKELLKKDRTKISKNLLLENEYIKYNNNKNKVKSEINYKKNNYFKNKNAKNIRNEILSITDLSPYKHNSKNAKTKNYNKEYIQPSSKIKDNKNYHSTELYGFDKTNNITEGYKTNKSYSIPNYQYLLINQMNQYNQEFLKESAAYNLNQLNLLFNSNSINANAYNFKLHPTITSFLVESDSKNNLLNILNDANMLEEKSLLNFIYIQFLNDQNIVIQSRNDNAPYISAKTVMKLFFDKIKNNIKLAYNIIPIGLKSNNSILSLNFNNNNNFLVNIEGVTDYNIFINTLMGSFLLTQNPNKHKMLILSENSFFKNFKSIPHLYGPIFQNSQKINLAIQKICLEIENRLDLFEDGSINNHDEFKAKLFSKIHMPRLTIIIDKIESLILSNNENAQRINWILKNANKAGINVITISNQNDFLLDTPLNLNLFNEKIFFQSNNKNYKDYIKEPLYANLYGNGDCIYYNELNSDLYRSQLFTIDKNDLANAIQESQAQMAKSYDQNFKSLSQKFEPKLLPNTEFIYNEASKLKLNFASLTPNIIQRELRLDPKKASYIHKLLTKY